MSLRPEALLPASLALVGVLAESFGIARSCWFCAAAAALLLVAALAVAARSPRSARA